MLTVIEPGALTTVQDLGRPGWARYGIPPSGPMDRAAFAAANALVGNPPDAAALEITLTGPTLHVAREALVAVCGASFELRADRMAVPMWHAVYLRAGTYLRFGRRRSGARAILAIAGGLTVPAFLDSRSTYLAGAFGGYEGRALRTGDRLPVGAHPHRQLWAAAGGAWPAERRTYATGTVMARVVLGPQVERLTPEATERFLNVPFTIAPASDRMGIRTDGPALATRDGANMISDGIVTGCVQVPPDGHPIIMMVDHQTTGGYPKIATVIRADLPLLAQCLPGDTLRFTAVTPAEARSLP